MKATKFRWTILFLFLATIGELAFYFFSDTGMEEYSCEMSWLWIAYGIYKLIT